MDNQSDIFSPSKINLVLKVGGKEPSGFHRVTTVVAKLDCGDNLSFSSFNDCKFESIEVNLDEALSRHLAEGANSFKSLLESESNLVLRAAGLFGDIDEFNSRLKFQLSKSLPAEAGLGGGSSNAAVVLKALSNKINLADSALLKKAGELGADIPHFLKPGLTIGTDYGNKVETINLSQNSLDFFRSLRVVLVKPNFGANTTAAYQSLGRGDCEAHQLPSPRDLLSGLGQFSGELFEVEPRKFASWVENDFDKSIESGTSEEGYFKQLLESCLVGFEQLALCSVLCGSGSTRAVIVKSEGVEDLIQYFKEKLPSSYWIAGPAQLLL